MTTKIIEQFKNYLEQIGYSQGTQRNLPSSIKEFLNHTQKELQEIDKQDVLAYYEYIKIRPNKRRPGTLSESRISNQMYALKVFFSFQMELGTITEDPMSTLTFVRLHKSKPREILSQSELKELYKACETYREKAVLSLCYGLGLRRSEAVKINVEDLNLKSGLAFVREGKGKKRRVIPMNESIIQTFKNYLEKERSSKEETTALICSKTGIRATGGNLNKTLKTILESTQITKTITLHCLRHSIATHLLENGLSVEYVRDFLGHKHLESTQIYTRVKNKQLWNLKSI